LPFVETVKGPMDTAQLGSTLMHEHVFVVTPEIEHEYPEWSWDGSKQDRQTEAIGKLQALKAAGISTIVDLTVLGLGRSVEDLVPVARETDVNIIVATGMYTFDHLPAFISRRPAVRPHSSDGDVLVDFFVKDITVGIGDTGVKAAVLKCCTEVKGVTPNIHRVLRAVARAHRLTGVPISTHSNVWHQTGRHQQRVFAEEGVDLSRVVIGHSGDTTDTDYLKELMDRGSSIGMDRFGLYNHPHLSFDERVQVVATLCAEGYADRMVLSHDTMCVMDDFPGFFEANPSWAYTHVSDQVLPALRERGVSDAQIDQMLVGNPQRIFAQHGGY
jgi:phosphotriesterase-related protein